MVLKVVVKCIKSGCLHCCKHVLKVVVKCVKSGCFLAPWVFPAPAMWLFLPFEGFSCGQTVLAEGGISSLALVAAVRFPAD